MKTNATTRVLSEVRRILIVRRDNIGDLVCTTPAIAALRRHFPRAEIGALVNSYNAEVLRGNPNLDHVFVYQKLKHAGSLANRFKALSQRLNLIRQLRRWKPDVSILAKSSYDRHGLNFARQIGAKNIIGFVPDNLTDIKGLPDIRLKTPEFSTLHEVEAINLLLEPLGVKDALGSLQVFPRADKVKEIRDRLPESECRIALHISAREIERRWGLENFVALTNYLLETKQNVQVILFWSPGKSDDPHHPGDDEAASQLMQRVSSARLIPMPTKNLTELIAALSCCDIFIGTDGGAMHLAAALNVPMVALFENALAKLNHWYPWQVSNRILVGSTPHVSSIEVSKVKRAVDEVFLEIPTKVKRFTL